MELLKNEERAVFALRALYRRYGYVGYKMSQFEEYDLYVRNKDFLLSDRIITFSGSGGRLLALKPDVTLSIVKNAPDAPGAVQKLYYNENVYRDYRGSYRPGWNAWATWGITKSPRWCCWRRRAYNCWGDGSCWISPTWGWWRRF